MISQTFRSATGARDPKDGGALSAAVFVTGRCSTVLLAGLMAALLAGCSGSDSSALSANDEADPLPASQGSTDGTGSPDTTGDDDSDSDNTPELSSSSQSADVLLLKPAGTTKLPVGIAPAVQFKSLDGSQSSTQNAARGSVRSPLLTDGGRSTIASGSEATNSATVTVSWDPPVQSADGSALDDLAGYRVYQGNQDQLSIVQELNETGSGERRLTQIPNVESANSCFAVTAYDTSANESALGDVVCKDITSPGPATNTLAPTLTSVTQLSSTDGQASISLRWQPPTESNAGAGARISLYSVYHGNQSQLFKIKEVGEQNPLAGADRSNVVTGIGGEQACFALTARYSDGIETSLGEIVCTALVHTTPPQPGNQLRPYNVTVDSLGGNSAMVGWDKPNTVVSSSDATGIDRYDLYQGSASQVYKIGEINESGGAGTRRTTVVENVFNGSNCFALTATDESRRQSALSTIVCGNVESSGSGPGPAPISGSVGVTNVTAQETSPGSVAISWDAPESIAAGQPIANLAGYNLYQGSDTQLFKVAELDHSRDTVRQQTQRTGVQGNNACFAVTAYDSNGYEAPLSEVVCAAISGAPSVPQYGIVPPTEVTTSALGGSTTVTLSWLASGAAATGTADPNVNRYNIYQGNHDRLYKVRQVKEEHDADPRASSTFTGVSPASACFAITAQYRDLRESRLSDIVCRDD